MAKNEFRVGTNPTLRCTCGQCGKRVNNQPPQSVETPTEFPVDANLVAAQLAAPKARMLTGNDRNTAIAKQNEAMPVEDHDVTTGRDGKLYRAGKLVQPK